ncbi:MAG: transcription termination/antitermination protein NusG [Verrucomicrobium sp.]
MPDPETALWYCIHTKPKCEHLAAAALRMLGNVETYCPRIRFQRSTPRGKVWFVEALFPSYFFARFIYSEAYRGVKHAHNVIRIVGFGGEAAPIPEIVIESLKVEMLGEELREVKYGVQVGDTVEVAEGPMRGLKGIVESFANGEQRVKLLLEFLGRQSLVEVPASKLLSERAPREVMKAPK